MASNILNKPILLFLLLFSLPVVFGLPLISINTSLSDTNVTTACSGDELLLGNGSCVLSSTLSNESDTLQSVTDRGSITTTKIIVNKSDASGAIQTYQSGAGVPISTTRTDTNDGFDISLNGLKLGLVFKRLGLDSWFLSASSINTLNVIHEYSGKTMQKWKRLSGDYYVDLFADYIDIHEDNSKLRFGESNDVETYYDGTDWIFDTKNNGNFIFTDGNIGIATLSPNHLFSLEDQRITDSIGPVLNIGNTMYDSSPAAILIDTDDSIASIQTQIDGVRRVQFGAGLNLYQGAALNMHSDASTDTVLLDGSGGDSYILGNVGIGINNPNNRLSVVVDTIDDTGRNALFIRNDNAAENQVRVQLSIDSDNSQLGTSGSQIFATGGASGWADYETRPLRFWTGTSSGAASLRMEIENDGTVNVLEDLDISGNLTVEDGSKLGIGTSSPDAQLHTTKGRVVGITRVTTTYTILTTDHFVFGNTDSSAYTVTLPLGVEGQSYKIINSGSSGNDLTVAPNGSEHLLGMNSSFILKDGESLILTYNSADGWY